MLAERNRFHRLRLLRLNRPDLLHLLLVNVRRGRKLIRFCSSSALRFVLLSVRRRPQAVHRRLERLRLEHRRLERQVRRVVRQVLQVVHRLLQVAHRVPRAVKHRLRIRDVLRALRSIRTAMAASSTQPKLSCRMSLVTAQRVTPRTERMTSVIAVQIRV